MSDLIELKPCPFCRSKGPDAEKYKDNVTGQAGRVHCYRCGADGPTIPYAPDDKFWTWNSRPAEDALRLERDQLLSVLQTIADQKLHPLGETPNAYHMRELARAALQEDTPPPPPSE